MHPGHLAQQILQLLQALLFHNRLHTLNLGYNYKLTTTGIRYVADFVVKVRDGFQPGAPTPREPAR